MIAVAARNDQLVLNDGTVINISTFSGDIDGNTFYAKGTKKPVSVFRITQKDIVITSVDLREFFTSDMLVGHPLSWYESDATQQVIDRIDSECHWLWGSFRSGGCYIRRVGNNDYKIGGVTGFVKAMEEEDNYYFLIREADRIYSYNTTSDIEVMFGYSENEMEGYDYPIIYVYSITNMRVTDASYPLTCYCYDLFNQLINNYGKPLDLTNLYDPTRYITWEGSLGDKPSMRIRPQVDVSILPFALGYPILGVRPNDNITLISGSPWGDGLVEEEEDDPSGEGGYSGSEAGGFGDYPSETGNVDFSDPTQMAINVINSGFVTLYNPSLSEVKSFNDWLFNDITDAISGTLKKLIADPIDYVLFLSLCHFTPPNSGAVTYTISYAGINTTVTSKKITNQFAAIDCGTIYLAGDTQTFLDYNPNTKISIYLPYIGINNLNSDDVVGSSIHVMYYVDLLTGACIAQIKCTRSVRLMAGDANLNDILYSFSGNCYEQIPITGTDWRGLASSIMQGVSGAVSLATGNLAGAGAIASAVMSDKNSVSHSGNMGGSFGYMDNQKPYLILERPINNLPYNYRGFKGYTLNQRRRLGSLKGYTEIEEGTLWTDSFNGISEEEADMLKQITTTGFYL